MRESKCKGCKVRQDAEYLASLCSQCRASGGFDRFDVESSADIDRRNAEGFAVTLRQIKLDGDLDPYEISIIILMQLGYNLSAIARVWNCTRANVAIKFKKLRERCPKYRFLVDWTPHGGRQVIPREAVDDIIEASELEQGELPL